MDTTQLKNNTSQLTSDSKIQPPNHWWLERNSDENIWYLKPDNHSTISSFTVHWQPAAVEQEQPDLGRWLQWKRYAQRLVEVIMESDKTDVTKSITLASYAREVRSICLWLCFANRLHHISCVTREHVTLYEEYIKELRITVNSVSTKLHILNMMWKLKDEVGTGLDFIPYHAGKLTAKAKRLGVPGKRTKTIPPEAFFYLLDKVLYEVEGADRWIGKLDSYIKIKADHGWNASTHYKKEHSESSTVLFRRLRVIYASAIVVILSLTAMRKHEATVLKYSDAISALDEATLNGTEHKTSHTETGKPTRRPLPEEGRKALKVIIELTKYTRAKIGKSERLFLRLPLQHSVGGNKTASYHLTTKVMYNLFDKLSKDVALDYSLRPHMLRRAFAMIWTWRFEIGDLDYLSRFLLHNNHLFTEIYVDDPDVYDFLPEEMQRYTARVFEQAFMGENDLKAGIENTVSRYRRLIRQKVSVIEPETVNIFITKIIDKFNYQVIPNADGYCFMSSARKSRAKCSTDGVNPDYANRNEALCSGCPNFGVDTSRLSYWEKRKDAHKAVLSSSEDELMQDASRVGVKRAERIISMFKEVD